MATEPLSAKRAPRRAVLEVIKAGDWGEVTYRHRLSCGHTAIRKRHSGALHIACTDCLKAIAFKERGPVLPEAVQDDIDFMAEIKHGHIQSRIASILGVEAYSVDLVVDSYGSIKHAMVFLSADDITRLTRGNASS